MMGSSNWLDRMLGWPFYQDWIISTVSVFVVLVYLDRIHNWLERRFPWFENNTKRVIWQAFLLVLAPAGMAILITYLQYEFLYDQSLIRHAYFQNEFLITLLVIGLVNLSYFIFTLLRRYRTDTANSPSVEPEGEVDAGLMLIGQRGAQRIPVNAEDIAMIWLESKVVFLRTFDGEKMLLSENLDSHEQDLPDSTFFRANRQMIVNRKACASFESIENGKIRIDLINDQFATVSQKKAARFREWIKN